MPELTLISKSNIKYKLVYIQIDLVEANFITILYRKHKNLIMHVEIKNILKLILI